ncbi:hypothetical protein HN481_02290 [Candidatus Parcubacteria bacterium]|jgi:hypothetical protein|nr:hypothetical protein [Candidatus Parcubacteria bacterium]
MPTPYFEKTMKSMKLKMQALWGAFLIAPSIYAGVLYKITSNNIDPASAPANDSFVYTLVIFSIMVVILSFFLPNFITKGLLSAIKSGKLSRDENIKQLLVSIKNRQELEKLSDKEIQDLRIIYAYFISFMLKIAMAESIAIYGLVLGIINHELGIFLYFAIPSILLLVIHRPNIDRALNRMS